MAATKYINIVTLPNGEVITSKNSREFTHAIVACSQGAQDWGVMAKATGLDRAEAARRWWADPKCHLGEVRIVPVTH